MSTGWASPDRRWLGTAILVAWVGIAALYARRIYFPPAPERLALAARMLPPGDAWYTVSRGTDRVGWARRQLDTLPSGRGFVIDEAVAWEDPGLGPAGRTVTRMRAWLGPGVGLDSLRYEGVSGHDTMRLGAVAEGDSVLVLDRVRRIRVSERPQLAASWPLRFAADGKARRDGAELRVTLFDPASATAADTRFRVAASELRAWPDSVDTDADGEWIVLRTDSARAWRLDRADGAVRLPTWVDEDGRVVEATLPGGLTIARTAFELAFLAEAGAEGAGEPPGGPP